MKIILCYPPKREYAGYGQDKRWLPLGIASLGAYIKREFSEIDIVLLDLFDYTVDEAFEEITKHIEDGKTNLIGYTVFTEQRFATWKLAEKVKCFGELSEKFNTKVYNIIGGPHAYLMAEQIYTNYHNFVDVIIKGEGELAWINMIKDLQKDTAWNGIIEGENIQDLNTLPHAIDGFDLFANTNKLIEAEAPIIFSRGCTDYCSFCSTTKFWKGYRSRSASNVFDEMMKYYIKYGITKFKFHDDASTADIENWKTLCLRIIMQVNNIMNIKWEYEITARADQFDDELIQLLAESGCKRVAVGIESGNEALRKAMNKNIDIELAKINIKKLMAAGIEVVALFIVGYAGESDETIQDTIDFIKEVKPTLYNTQPLMIFPGTKIYRDCVKWGWINDDYWLQDVPQPYYLREQKPDKINQWVQKLQNCMKKVNILLAVPARQTEEIFELFMDSLNKLKIPENVNLVRFFALHNSPNLKQYLSVSDQYQEITTPEQYKTDENTHYWKNENLKFITGLKNQFKDVVVANGFDYVFFVDSDLILHPNTLQNLLKANKDIIAEVFWTSWEPDSPEMPNAWDIDHYGFYQGTIEKYRESGQYKCGGTGACILIHRRVFEKGVNYDTIPNISFWGEDRAFCIRAAVAGFEIWLDTTVPAFHLYRPSIVEQYKRRLSENG